MQAVCFSVIEEKVASGPGAAREILLAWGVGVGVAFVSGDQITHLCLLSCLTAETGK